MSELKPMTKTEAYWSAVADDTITPPEPQTTEECILAAMSGNYPVEEIKPQTREQELMMKAVEKTGTPAVQNVVFEKMTTFDITPETLCNHITELVIPEGVTSFSIVDAEGDNKIYPTYSNLKKITFPSTMINIPEKCLYEAGTSGATGFEEIIISEGTTTIGNYAFYDVTPYYTGASEKTKVTLPKTLISIGEYAFVRTKLGEITLPPNLAKIGKMAFAATDLTEVVIPSSVVEIGEEAFGTHYSGSQTPITKIIINAPENSISGAPWGATNAEIIWNG